MLPAAKPRLVAVVACEPSGDALGAALVRALRSRSLGPLRFFGVGGDRMAAEGFDSLFPMRDLSAMGFAEVVPRLATVLRRQRKLANAIAAERPDIVVTIDSSSFNKGLARRLIRAEVRAPRLHYVAPMVWAWRPGRAHGMARRFHHLMTLFPFEPALFAPAGLPATCVGHPAVEAAQGDGEAFRRRHGIPLDVPLLCLLPGSRPAEVRALLPRFHEAARLLKPDLPSLAVVLPTVASVAPEVRSATRGWDIDVTVVSGEEQKQNAFAASDAALAASGTVVLELALASVPMVIAYRPSPISGWLAARLIRLPYVGLVNILLGRPVVPELLRGECRPDALAATALPLLNDGAARQSQLDAFREIRALLDPGEMPPSERAADLVLALASGIEPGQIGWISQRGGEDERRQRLDGLAGDDERRGREVPVPAYDDPGAGSR